MTSHPFDAHTRRHIEARLNGPARVCRVAGSDFPARRPVSSYDRDLQIIGLGLAAAALWVVVFRLAQIAGAVS